MGGYHSQVLREETMIAYVQIQTRSQLHEVAVIPTTLANFPDPNHPTFVRLHNIYSTCPRVRKHLPTDALMDRAAFYKHIVLDSSHPSLPIGTCIPVVVATRWRGDEEWDVAGLISCRGYGAHGDVQEVSEIQIFFRDGHKVPLTMPALQLAATLFAEMHRDVDHTTPTPWARNVEWTIGRSNMEVRRVLEAMLVFWGLRPAQASMNEPAFKYYRRTTPKSHDHDQDATYATFPLELAAADTDRITVRSRDPTAIASLLTDLARLATEQSSWLYGCAPLGSGLEALLPETPLGSGRALSTRLTMSFRGTQQKTPKERRDILGAEVADILDLIQPISPPGVPPAALKAAPELQVGNKEIPTEAAVPTEQEPASHPTAGVALSPPSHGACHPYYASPDALFGFHAVAVQPNSAPSFGFQPSRAPPPQQLFWGLDMSSFAQPSSVLYDAPFGWLQPCVLLPTADNNNAWFIQ